MQPDGAVVPPRLSEDATEPLLPPQTPSTDLFHALERLVSQKDSPDGIVRYPISNCECPDSIRAATVGFAAVPAALRKLLTRRAFVDIEARPNRLYAALSEAARLRPAMSDRIQPQPRSVTANRSTPGCNSASATISNPNARYPPLYHRSAPRSTRIRNTPAPTPPTPHPHPEGEPSAQKQCAPARFDHQWHIPHDPHHLHISTRHSHTHPSEPVWSQSPIHPILTSADRQTHDSAIEASTPTTDSTTNTPTATRYDDTPSGA